MKNVLFVVLLGMLAACTNAVEDLKSPCVGGDGSPCDRRAPVNQSLG